MTSPRSTPTVLIADDEPALRRVLEFTFEKGGFRVLSCPDGVDALSLIRLERPDAAILDAMMPGLTGPEICERVRAESDIAGTKLILLSAKGEEDLAALAAACGADAHQSKPFSPSSLLSLARRLLSLPDDMPL